MFDVIEVSIESRRIITFTANNKTKRNAEAILEMAVCRRGVEENFYVVVETGKYKIGDTY
jgi:hypothetical protein